MKKLTTNLALLVAICIGFTQTSCIGSFSLTNNLYNWNNQVGDRFVNALIFAGFVILPVYAVTLFIDGIVLNTIEFWSGSNPVSMEEGESETQIVSRDGVTYQITAVKNKFIVEQLEGINAGEIAEFEFVPAEKSWYLHADGKTSKIASIDEFNKYVSTYNPQGEIVSTESIDQLSEQFLASK